MNTPPAAPSVTPLHGALILLLFTACALLLLQPLFVRAPAPSDSAGEVEAPAPNFTARAELNQTARVVVGLDRLATRVPALGSELRREIEKLLAPLAAPDSSALHRFVALALHVYLEEDTEQTGLLRASLAGEIATTTQGPASTLELLERLYVDRAPLEIDELNRIRAAIGFAGDLAALESGRLAGESNTDELAAELSGRAERFLLRFGFTILVMLGLLATGSMLFLLGLNSAWRGKLEYRWDGERLPAWLHLETFTAFLVLLIGLSAAREFLPGMSSDFLGAAVLLQALLLLVIAWPRLYKTDWRHIRDDLGMGGGRWLRESAFGAVGYLAGLPLLTLGFVSTMLMLRITGMELDQGIHPIAPAFEEARSSPLDVLAILVLAVVLAPLIEELMFRGFFYNALRTRFGAPLTIFLSAALFAGIHPQGWIGLPPLLAVGVTLGILREWRGSIVACVVAHALNNGVVMLLMFMMF